MKRLSVAAAVGIFCMVLMSAPVSHVHAAQLLMFDADDCEWCARWDKDVGVVYAKTDEGKILPLRRVDIHRSRPDDLKWVEGVVYTPTFVLIDKGQEVGRISGYPGEDHFWGLLGVLIEKWRKKTGS